MQEYIKHVYIIVDYYENVCGVFSSFQAARNWLDFKAVQENGWLPSEVKLAQIRMWPVDAE